MSIPTVRYKTSGSHSKFEIQPMISGGVVPVVHAHVSLFLFAALPQNHSVWQLQ